MGMIKRNLTNATTPCILQLFHLTLPRWTPWSPNGLNTQSQSVWSLSLVIIGVMELKQATPCSSYTQTCKSCLIQVRCLPLDSPCIYQSFNACLEVPSIEGSIDWFANGNHDSAVKCSTTQPGTHPVSPSLLEDHGCDFQVYHPGFEPSTDLKAFLSSSFSTQDSRFLNTPNDPQAPHTIQRLPSSEVRHVDSFLERQNISGKHKWTCHYPSCEGSASWRNKDAARSHVYKHLNETKLFKCVQWYVFLF